MNIKPIKTEEDYEEALERVYELSDAKANTPEGDELDVLITLVHGYEEKNYPISAPDPVEALKHIMEARGLERKDLIPFLGKSNRISEIMNKQRSLSLGMIRKLHKELRIPAEVLIKEYKTS